MSKCHALTCSLPARTYVLVDHAPRDVNPATNATADFRAETNVSIFESPVAIYTEIW